MDINISSALPPSDDFRTSLLMTGLSARFSMLREQDDPNSMLGKASDDSVLSPRRQSRLDFGQSMGLDDIAEVGSIRAPFARQDSFQSTDDAASISGSIMNRAKPTDGNNLFGGRQKVYKISNSATAKQGGLTGRAVYEDDVAQSAFQRWRQSERERQSLEDEDELNDTHEDDSPQMTSLGSDFSKRRETNSTTSSGPSAARNSTAATSVTSSHPASSLKDWQPSGVPSSGSSPALHPERSVTRTRRLYEQSLTQDLHEQQSSALSRIDTLSRSRFGRRTPDVSGATSPTNAPFGDRFNERRPITTKASAPNIRSFSPSASTPSHASPVEPTSKFAKAEQKPAHATSPPLSPPISETEEHPTLAIQPDDRGKATALGFFSRPAQQYDESRFAQRQKQLQQGRETPTSRHRAESNASNPTDRSRSSSLPRPPYERSDSGAVKTEPTVKEETTGHSTFLDMGDEEDSVAPIAQTDRGALQVSLERPDDEEHPAFRRSALPTPLSFTSRRSSDDPLPSATNNPKNGLPDDSPTLGPGAGLSGMVRQHLRNVSNASSVYGGVNREDMDFDSSPESGKSHMSPVHHNAVVMDWDNPYASPTSPMDNETSEDRMNFTSRPSSQPTSPDAKQGNGEHEDFARHLANGARRVREKLTSYVESDQSRSTSPAPQPLDVSQEWAPPRPNAFSILRPKSSRGSLIDRERNNVEYSQTKPQKSPAINPPSRIASPPRPRGSSLESSRVPSGGESKDMHVEPKISEDESPGAEKEEPVHAGLKAFRQARRELQRMKEREVQQRKQAPQEPNQPPPPPPPPRSQSPPMPILQPVAYNPMAASEEAPKPRSRSGSRAGYHHPGGERDRSGSEASSGGQPPLRPRYRAASSARDEQRSFSPGHAPPSMPYHGQAASPGGSDYRRSPMMPPYASRGEQSPGPYSRPGSATGHRGPSSASTPNMGMANPSAPPLPPINPRRKNMAGNMGPRSDGSMPTSPHQPLSPEKMGPGRRPVMLADTEGDPSQYRQQLRRVPHEAASYGPPGPAGRPYPRDGPRHPPPQGPPPRGDSHRGMI